MDGITLSRNSMTSFSTDNLVFHKAFGCLDGGDLGLGGSFLVDRGQKTVVRGQTFRVRGQMGLSRGQRAVDGGQMSQERRESALERSQMSLERAHNRLERGQILQGLDIFQQTRPRGKHAKERGFHSPVCAEGAAKRWHAKRAIFLSVDAARACHGADATPWHTGLSKPRSFASHLSLN